jgi:hypothetical protein
MLTLTTTSLVPFIRLGALILSVVILQFVVDLLIFFFAFAGFSLILAGVDIIVMIVIKLELNLNLSDSGHYWPVNCATPLVTRG